MQKNSLIYIAGHRGLVGSAILKNLQEKGYTNFVTKTHKELDLTNQQAVADFFKTEKPEYVFLAAAKVGGIVANNTYRADFIYENLQIQNNVIHQSYKNGVKKLLFLGSTCIYPKNAPQPMKEEYLLTDTLEYTNEPYAIAKIAGIKMCENYNLQYDTNFISVMPTNLYGPNDNFNLETSHVLPALIRKIHLGKALENDDWQTIRKDLNKRPIEGTAGKSNKEDIIQILNKYGVKQLPSVTLSACPTKSFRRGVEGSQSAQSVSIEIWGSGKPMREFLWSEDMADACVYIFEHVNFKDLDFAIPRLREKQSYKTNESVTLSTSPTKSFRRGDEMRNTHINIGTGKDISIANLAEMIKQTIGFTGDLVYNTTKPDGTMKKLIDVSKLHQLGWHHKVILEKGIEKLYDWYYTKN